MFSRPKEMFSRPKIFFYKKMRNALKRQEKIIFLVKKRNWGFFGQFSVFALSGLSENSKNAKERQKKWFSAFVSDERGTNDAHGNCPPPLLAQTLSSFASWTRFWLHSIYISIFVMYVNFFMKIISVLCIYEYFLKCSRIFSVIWGHKYLSS